ncbi:MAG: hypothetical protein WAV18_20285, partial [Roseiarcus sp.]
DKPGHDGGAAGVTRFIHPGRPLIFLYKLGSLFVHGERPACTEKRKARFIQRDRPEAGVEPAQKNYGYFFPEIEFSVRLKILSIWIAAAR